MTFPIRYSRGRAVTDDKPRQHEAADFAAFVAALDADRAADKKTAPYFCGPLNGDGRRCAEGALPRRWLAQDLDAIEADRLADVLLWFAGFSGAAWPTHSSKPEAPRYRIILELDREVTRTEALRIGATLRADLDAEFGQAVKVDPCTERGEQPVFAPPAGVTLSRFMGDALNVERYLQAAPEQPQAAAQAAGGRPEAGELLARIRGGDDLHGCMRTLLARWAAAGLGAEEMEAAAVGLLETARPARGARVDEFAGAELAGLIDGAIKKFSPRGAYVGEGAAAPQPLDIFRTIAAPALSAEDFPSAIRDYAVPLAQASGHDPGAYLLAMLAGAAAAAHDGLRLLLDPDTSWFESPRVWVLLLGSPGSAKTPAIRAAMAPMFAIHKTLREQHARTVAGLGKDEQPPPMPSLYSNDPTIEALSDVLVANPRGIVGVFEELDSWLGSHDAYRSGGSKDRGEWLRLFDGGPHQVDRIKRGSVFVPNWGASILGATTPAGLQRHAKDLPPDGLIQRFLPVIVRPMGDPASSPELRASIKPARERFEGALRALFAAQPGTVRLAPEAARVFFDRCRALRGETEAVGATSAPMAGHVAKHAGLMARVALTMHALEHGDMAREVLLDAATMQRAERLLRTIARHALAMFGMLAGGDAGSALALARAVGRAIVAGQFEDVTRRDLIQACRAYRDASEQAREAALRFLTCVFQRSWTPVSV